MELLNPGIGLLFWQTVTFLVLLFILGKFAWKPITSALHERENSINNALQAAEQARKEMAKLNAENEKILAQANNEANAILLEAKKQTETMISEAKLVAEKEAKKKIEQAMLAIENEKQAAITQVRNMAATLSIDIAERILAKNFEDRGQQIAYAEKHLKDIHLN